jgi:sugar lactone lactonase YvrE
MKSAVLASLLLLAACGDDGGSNHATPDAGQPQIDASVPQDTTGTDLRNQSIELAGGANGVFWDDATKTLYLTDDTANTFLKYTDAGGVQTVATLPTLTGGSNPGGIAKLADGTFITPNFAMGMMAANTLFTIDAAAKTTKALTGLDASHHRIGVGTTSTGDIYDVYFAGMGAGMQTGSIAKVTVAGDGSATEIPLTIAGAAFKKLVGIVVTDTALYVTDQTANMVFKVEIPADTLTTVGTVTSADLMTVMPNGDLITGGTGVRRLTPAGVETTLFSTETFGAVHGSAYDPTGKRLFFINHSATAGTKDHLEVRPLDQ